MRIGLVIYGGINTLSGGYLYDRRLVDHLRMRGDRVEIISLHTGSYFHGLRQNLANDIYGQIKGLGPDILLEDEICHASLLNLNTKLRCPAVSIVHHLRSCEAHAWPLNRIYSALEKSFLSSVDGHIIVSHHTKSTVMQLTGPDTRSIVCPPGKDHINPEFDRKFISRRAAEPGPLRILFVGNIIPRKGLHNLIAAMARLNGACELSVVGDKNCSSLYFRRIERQITRLKLTNKIVLHGALTGKRLSDEFLNAQVLAVPSAYEGYGIVYVEALGYGLPVIASSRGGASEIIRDNIDGYLLKAEDVDGLVVRLNNLHSDREMLERMSLAAVEHFETFPTWNESFKRARDFLIELIETG